MRRLLLIILALSFAPVACAQKPAAGTPAARPAAAGTVAARPAAFEHWAAVVVGADSLSSDNQPTPIFDNARRDVAAALIRAGFARGNMAQLSVNPNAEPGVAVTEPKAFTRLAQQVTRNAPGCLFYFTSHGNQQGIRFGQGAMLDPSTLGGLVSQWCGQRPTIVVISACYSGVFVPALAASNRMVMTAARSDRSSFGCGGHNLYPYFDDCVISSMPQSTGFIGLADAVRACVARREQETKSSPASDPQVSIGDQIRPILGAMRFRANTHPPPRT